jgi:thiamine pyrophosphokinase
MKSQIIPHKRQRIALVICNGKVLSKKDLAPLLQGRPFVLCADGGANMARRLGIRPNAIVGDLDSISRSTRKFFSGVETIRMDDQYSTDLEKALDVLLERGFHSAVVVGAMGGRPDHSLANLSILMKYHRKMDLQFSDTFCDICIIDRKVVLNAGIGSVISLMPLGRCEGVTTSGLKYPLLDETLELGVREGTSNEVVSSHVRISVKNGILVLFVVKKK